jgi:periplasmic protein TonB
MELLTHFSAVPFARVRPGRSTRRLGFVASLVVHGALLAAMAVASLRPALSPVDEPVSIEILAAPEAPAEPVPPMPEPQRPKVEPKIEPKIAPPKRPVVLAATQPIEHDEPPPPSDAADEPLPAAAPAVEAATPASAGAAVTVPTGGATTGPRALGGSQRGPGGSGLGGGAPPVLGPAARRALLDQYTKLFGPRIRQHFRYPRQAEDLEVEGAVLVRVAVDGRGQLVQARTEGGCPHELLCEDAVRTVRASAPFPPPPAALGAPVEVYVPLNYTMQ